MNRQAPDSGNSKPRIFGWLCAGVLWGASLALGGVFVPVQFRPVGLFLIAFGVIAGVGLGTLARLCRSARTPRFLFLAILLVAGSETSLVFGSYCQHVESVKRETQQALDNSKAEFANDPTARFEAQFQEQAKAGHDKIDPESARQRQEFRDELDRIARLRYKRLEEIEQEGAEMQTFPGYLKYRVSRLGTWRSPWPVLFVCSEIIFGSIAGGWAAWESLRRRQESVRFEPNAIISN